MNTAQEMSSGPWWKYGHMWLVVAGPTIVVLASMVTIYLAVTRPDPVYADAPKTRSVPMQSSGTDGAGPALTPAMQARNHAASPGLAAQLEGTAPQRQTGHP